MRRFAAGRAASGAITVLAVMLGCSDGSEGPDFTIAFDPAHLDAYATVDTASDVPLHATISPRPSSVVYPMVTTGQSQFQTQFWALEETPGTWAVRFTTNPLALGSYDGELTLHLCRDQGCATEYTTAGATLPYTLTVLPAMALSVRVGDATLPAGDYYNASPITSGEAMTIVSNVPVARFELGSHTIGSVTLTEVSRAETSWTVVPTGSYDTFGILVVAVTGESAQIFFSFQ